MQHFVQVLMKLTIFYFGENIKIHQNQKCSGTSFMVVQWI